MEIDNTTATTQHTHTDKTIAKSKFRAVFEACASIFKSIHLGKKIAIGFAALDIRVRCAPFAIFFRFARGGAERMM